MAFPDLLIDCTWKDNRLWRVSNEMRKNRGLHISLLLWNYETLKRFSIWTFTQAGKIMEKRALETMEAQFSTVYGLMETVCLFSQRGKEKLSFHTFSQLSAFTPLSCWHCTMEWEVNGVVEVPAHQMCFPYKFQSKEVEFFCFFYCV